jgi:hypothetical protein
MWTYQVRERDFKVEEGESLVFPNSVELQFELRPLQQLGAGLDQGRTAVKGVPATVHFHGLTGKHWIESETSLDPLEVTIEDGADRMVELRGSQLRVQQEFATIDELRAFTESLFFGLPILLNVEFNDPPLVDRVFGRVGETPFRWELTRWTIPFATTTMELQETKFAVSWQRFETLSQPENRRLIAALHYYHLACRLETAGDSPWEFMGEVILNLSKTLEVLFPGREGQTIDAARTGLASLDLEAQDIERYFIPAMALRNSIDSGHALLSIFTRSQLRVIHAYTEGAINSFRHLLQLVVEKVARGEFSLAAYADMTPSRQALTTIDRLAPHVRAVESQGVPFEYRSSE